MAEEDTPAEGLGSIILHHKGIDATCEVRTEAQAAILAESGWTSATKAQREEFLSGAAEAEGGGA